MILDNWNMFFVTLKQKKRAMYALQNIVDVLKYFYSLLNWASFFSIQIVANGKNAETSANTVSSSSHL